MLAIVNALFVLGFAWIVRALLGARELTWGRTLVAVAAGYVIGAGVAGVLLVDFSEMAEPDVSATELNTLAMPFQIIATMAMVVVLELLIVGRRRRRSLLRPVRPFKAVARGLRILRRGLAVTRIVTRHGLGPVLGLRKKEGTLRSPYELARRARVALEEAGGMFVKLGQLLATRPDLVPPDALEELGRLHAAASPLPRSAVEDVVTRELGASVDTAFASFTWEPLGSASIAQVHAATLHDGREVVLKVRRPGLEDLVERDLAISQWMGRFVERRTSWGRVYGTGALAEEFADALRAELDFRVEGRHAIEMARSAERTRSVRVPKIIEEYTTDRVLVMERLDGRPLSQTAKGDYPADARAVADELCASQVKAMLEGDRFHGDPHPGNVMLLADGGVGLIDFGVTGRLDAFERSSVFQMLVALKLEEPTLLYESLVAVGAISPSSDPDRIQRSFARFMAANLGPGLPPADALTDLLRLVAELGIRLPPQTSVMFRALATLAGTLEHLCPGYPLIEQVADIGGAELRERMSPRSVGEFVQHEWAQLGPLLRRAPRHLDRLATLAEHGGLTMRVRMFAEAADVRVAERLLNRALLVVLSLGGGLLSVLMLGTQAGPTLAAAELRLVEVLGWAGLFGATVLMLRVLLDVLRVEGPDG